MNSTSESANQAFWENALVSFNTSLVNTVRSQGAASSCVEEILSLMCFHVFPVCDYDSSVSRPRQVCSMSVCCMLARTHTHTPHVCMSLHVKCVHVCVLKLHIYTH